MRTHIEIDEQLLQDALEATGLKTKQEVVEFALKQLLRLHRQADLRKLRGKFDWQGDLDAMRLD